MLHDRLYLPALGKAASQNLGSRRQVRTFPVHTRMVCMSTVTATREIPTPHATTHVRYDERLHEILTTTPGHVAVQQRDGTRGLV
jgi:hypothetical protein